MVGSPIWRRSTACRPTAITPSRARSPCVIWTWRARCWRTRPVRDNSRWSPCTSDFKPGVRRQLAGWRARAQRLGDQWNVVRGEWQAERALERIVSGGRPIVAGPWVSEVGYEVLYWVPFLRWVAAAYRIPPERFIVMSRGGTASWYGTMAAQYVEVFDHASPAELAQSVAQGRLKQRDVSDLDRRLIASASAAVGLRDAHVLHPSLMFR